MDEATAHRRALDARWLLTQKRDGSGLHLVKARLLITGFQDPGIEMDKVPITACVARKESYLLVASTAALKVWALLQLDISVAFLKTAGSHRDVFVKAPM